MHVPPGIRGSRARSASMRLSAGMRRFAPSRHGVSVHARVLALGALVALALTVVPTRALRASTAAASAGNWIGWTPAAGPTAISPALAFNPVAGTLELATVRADLVVDHNRFVGGSWSAPAATGGVTALPPVLVVDAAGTPHLLVTGNDGRVMHSRFQGGAWGPATPTGASSVLPPAAAVNSAGNTPELITVAADGTIRHSRFLSNVWSNPLLLSGATSLPPALVANPSGGLELAVVGADRQVYHARFSGEQWNAFQATRVFTEVAPALAVSTDGVVLLVATDLDHFVVHSRFVNNAWAAPVATGIQSSLSPTLVSDPGSIALELLARGQDRTVQHGRFTGGAWSAPVSLGIATDARPALVAEAGADLDAAVVGTDGKTYVNHFQAPVAPAVSFKTDILRLFTNNGAATCTGCHSGRFPSQGLNLAANQAYQKIVNVASSEKPSLKLVIPGDADHSYLFMKITGASGISGSPMPQGGPPLSAQDIDLLRRWINAGAPNN